MEDYNFISLSKLHIQYHSHTYLLKLQQLIIPIDYNDWKLYLHQLQTF